MHRLIVTAAIYLLIGISPLFARGGGMHGRHTSALSSPANPSVPPSLTPDARLTGSAPLPPSHPHTTVTDGTNVKPDPEDTKVDKIVKSICRGC